ncbi:hypothetical protein TNCV_4921071 [Trichonephila clavipes]|uniref:Uncharacterized protein n=1 Tax=Trichonephila clavipes TaxID=2585209 RepID=A0A8X6RM88_TRICX|nr:hypothetical protein TNCV_4921071 [Trichonephila clavipes]
MSFLVMEVLCWFSGPTPQTDDGGMREGRAGAVHLVNGEAVMILRAYATNGRWRNEGSTRAVVLGVGGPVLVLRLYATNRGWRNDGGTRAVVLGVGGPVWFSGLTLQTDDGGMRKGIINDFYTFCYLEYFVRAGLVVHGDGGAMLGHRPYSQTDDGGMMEAGAVDLGDGGAVMILRAYATNG